MNFLKTFWSVCLKYCIVITLLLGIVVCFIGLFIGQYDNIFLYALLGYAVGLLLISLFRYHQDNLNPEFTYRILKLKNSLSHYGLFIKIFPLFLTLVFAVTGDQISESTKLVFNNNGLDSLQIDIYVTLFWALLAAWAILLPLYFTRNDRVNSERLNELLNSIHNSPDKTLFKTYPDYYQEMLKGIDKVASDRSKNEEQKNIDQIHIILKTISEIVKYFSPHADNIEHIGANIWLIFSKQDQTDLINSLPPQINFHCTYQEDAISGVLVLLEDLIVTGNNSKNFDLPSNCMILPLPKTSTQNNIQYALPGTPKAAREGLSIYNDISLLHPDLRDFKASTQTAIKDYFSPKGGGKAIKSFASIRIGNAQNPIAVVNIDSQHNNILGDKQYYPTFFALLEPILTILRPKVLKYRGNFVQSKNYPWINKP
jgi:hypothetical protein